ncbi:MAG: TRAP transporter substrate-binding protein [Balneolaceae bacterium]|nr:TRAP transporter substrate-binding protein [Balneolaceae bacterium]
MVYRSLTAFALTLSLVFIVSCSGDDDVTVLKLGHGLDSTHPVHLAMEYMAERTREYSEGNIRIDVYPGQQLGTERELLELLQIGSVDITKVSSSVIEGFDPIYKVFSVPFLFVDEEHRYNVWDGEIGRELLDAGERIRLMGLTYYDAGTRSFYTKDTPINHPDDLAGLRIRVQESPASIQMVNLLGGSATPISWGEIYTALQQGIVDGAENNAPSFHLSRHYEVARYYSINEHTAVPDILYISLSTWNRLSESEQEIIQQAADESAIYQRRLWREATERAMDEVQAAGVEVVYPDKEPFIERLQPLYQVYMDESDELKQFIERIQELADG